MYFSVLKGFQLCFISRKGLRRDCRRGGQVEDQRAHEDFTGARQWEVVIEKRISEFKILEVEQFQVMMKSEVWPCMWVLKEGTLEGHWRSLTCEAGGLQGYQNKWWWGREGGVDQTLKAQG